MINNHTSIKRELFSEKHSYVQQEMFDLAYYFVSRERVKISQLS